MSKTKYYPKLVQDSKLSQITDLIQNHVKQDISTNSKWVSVFNRLKIDDQQYRRNTKGKIDSLTWIELEKLDNQNQDTLKIFISEVG